MYRIKLYLKLARIHQYIKNGFVFLPLFFSHRLGDWPALWSTAMGFLAFCFLASAIYVINDLRDIADDQRHPVKRLRPLASGAIGPGAALAFMLFLLVLSGATVFLFLDPLFFSVVGCYLALNILYSFLLKRLSIIDVACIALGFVLRIYAGGITAEVPVSHWLVILTFLLAIFLGLAKRRDDLLISEEKGIRKSLDGYNLEFISVSMGILASIIVVAYILYSVSPENILKHGTDKLYLTSFWVLLGLLRYLQITLVLEQSGSPTMVLAKDTFLQSIIALWFLTLFVLFYVL